LHTSKQTKRGYNQSELFAKGLALGMGIPYSSELLLRALPSETQTKKSKFERWKNVNEIFIVPFPEKLEQKHVLLVDDVITTGATIEACARQLFLSGAARVSVLCIAAPVS
jgi:ComF family protein